MVQVIIMKSAIRVIPLLSAYCYVMFEWDHYSSARIKLNQVLFSLHLFMKIQHKDSWDYGDISKVRYR